MLEAVAASPTPVRRLIVTAEPVTSVDVTAADSLIELLQALNAVAIEFCFAELKDPVKDKLKRFWTVRRTRRAGHSFPPSARPSAPISKLMRSNGTAMVTDGAAQSAKKPVDPVVAAFPPDNGHVEPHAELVSDLRSLIAIDPTDLASLRLFVDDRKSARSELRKPGQIDMVCP